MKQRDYKNYRNAVTIGDVVVTLLFYGRYFAALTATSGS